MKAWPAIFSTVSFAEITEDTLKLEYQSQTLELPLALGNDGRLQNECRQSIEAELRKVFPRSLLQPKVRLLCGVSARGLSLRRLSIPAINEEARGRLLGLQIESEFPLAPENLAWGSVKLNGAAPTAQQVHQEQVLVAAVRKEKLQEYAEIFASCGVVPVFVPAALARAVLCPAGNGGVAHLEIGAKTSELLLLEDGNPTQLTIVPWGRERCGDLDAEPGAPEVLLTEWLRKRTRAPVFYLSGAGTEDGALARLLSQELGTVCEPLQAGPPGRRASAAVSGLARATKENQPLLRLNIEPAGRRHSVPAVGSFPVKWAIAAAALLLLAALFPYFEALMCKPRLARKLAELKADRGRLRAIDSELEFLRYFKQTQPPYLDALYMVSRAVPAGARFDSLSMSRRGELSLKGSVRDANQIADFRAKLLDSGLFSTVAVEEQNPTPDRQKLLVRITAQWKPGEATRELAALNAAKEPERPKTASASYGPGMLQPGMTPASLPGLPAGTSVPPTSAGGSNLPGTGALPSVAPTLPGAASTSSAASTPLGTASAASPPLSGEAGRSATGPVTNSQTSIVSPSQP